MKLIPTIIQDNRTKHILMLGYSNEASYEKTLETGKVWFYSRKRKKLWKKGETSKNCLTVKKIKWDCDKDTLLIQVTPLGPACHRNTVSCFDNAIENLYEKIKQRKEKLPKNSYTAYLFQKGLDKICAKIREEGKEVIKAARKENKKRLIEETVDLLYHIIVMAVFSNIKLDDLNKEILKRRKS